MKLTVKQQKFADEYILTANAYKSAIAAGYSKSYAKTGSCKMLDNPNVRAYINARMEEISNNKIMQAEEVMERLTKIARREELESVVIKLAEEDSFYEEGRKKTVKREVPEVVEVPTTIRDTNKALELLGRRYLLFAEKRVEEDKTIKVKFENAEKIVK